MVSSGRQDRTRILLTAVIPFSNDANCPRSSEPQAFRTLADVRDLSAALRIQPYLKTLVTVSQMLRLLSAAAPVFVCSFPCCVAPIP